MKKEKLTVAKKFYKIISAILDIILVPVIILSIFCCFIMFNAKAHNMVPNILGYSAVTIMSPSMVASGFNVGESYVVRTHNAKGLQCGDIIAFYHYTTDTDGLYIDYIGTPYTTPENESKYGTLSIEYLLGIRSETFQKVAESGAKIYFHQIVAIKSYDGHLWFQTKGTSNASPDSYWVKDDYIVGIYEEMPAYVTTILTFIGSTDGIVWMVIIPIAIIMFLLVLEFIDNWDKYEMEQKLVKGEIYLTDKMCINKKIGYDMSPKNKLIVLLNAPLDYKQTYINLLWNKGQIPKGIVKHYKKQGWSERETEKLDVLRQEVVKEYSKPNPNSKVLTAYEKAVEQYNQMEYKIRGDYYKPNEATQTIEEIKATQKNKKRTLS